MKKAKSIQDDELRPEYVREEFPEGLVRGKYAERLREASNVVVFRPEVAAVFQTGDEVNPAAHIRTPRLLHPEDMADFKKTLTQINDDAAL